MAQAILFDNGSLVMVIPWEEERHGVAGTSLSDALESQVHASEQLSLHIV